MRGLAEAGLAEMRALIFELRPESLEAEGLVAAKDGVLVEINSETDFVAKNAEFQTLADQIVAAAATAKPADLDELKALPLAGSTVDAALQALAAKIGAVNAVVATDVTESGNTSAASIPLALSKLQEQTPLPSGAPVLLFAFGGGLAYAGQVVRMP